MKKKEILCLNPNCLEVFREDEALFVCNYHGQEPNCEKKNIHFDHSRDYMVFQYHNKMPWYMRMKWALNIKSLCTCPKCGKITYQRACPKCHSELVGETEKGFETFKFICMVGASSSGKTAFLYSLMHHISKISSATKITCMPHTTLTTVWLEDMNKKFQNEGRLPPTRNLGSALDLDSKFRILLESCEGKFSIVYRITIPSSQEPIYLISPDPEGEIYTDPQKARACRLLLSRADAIFYFINPLSLPAIRRELTISEEETPLLWQDLILSKICQMLNEIGHAKRTVPFAVIITHTDKIFDLLKERYNIDLLDFTAKEYTGYYSVNLGNTLSEKCKNFLIELDMGNFVTTVENEFKVCSFFFTAAHNEKLQKNNPPYSIEPFRVVDPLLWVLWKYNYIQGDSDG